MRLLNICLLFTFFFFSLYKHIKSPVLLKQTDIKITSVHVCCLFPLLYRFVVCVVAGTHIDKDFLKYASMPSLHTQPRAYALKYKHTHVRAHTHTHRHAQSVGFRSTQSSIALRVSQCCVENGRHRQMADWE